MYDLEADPTEVTNLMSGTYRDPKYDAIKAQLKKILHQQRLQKRKLPHSLNAWSKFDEIDTVPPRRDNTE